MKIEKPFIPSAQQSGVFDWVERGRGHAFIEAVAGAGKTTTLIKACQKMQGTIAFAAYNKKIADEIKRKLAEAEEQCPGLSNRVRAGTFHSFGLQAWRRVADKGLIVDTKGEKNTSMLERCNVPDDVHQFVVKLVGLAKQSGVGLLWHPSDDSVWYDIIEHHDLDGDIDDPDLVEQGIKSSRECVEWCRSVGKSIINFDDMIWLPAITSINMWQNDWVLIDEAQDTNPVRRVLARKMVKRTGRSVWVGDRHQAIYGFTGADNDAVDQIIEEFNCKQLPLTITYRCPKTVVKEAQNYVGHIQAHESAPAGKVTAMVDKDFQKLIAAKQLKIDDTILCRNTKPLVKMAFRIIKQGTACKIEGREIGTGLIKLVKRYKVKSLATLIDKLVAFRDRQVEKLMAKGREAQAEAISDQIETIVVMSEQGCETIDDLINKINDMFVDSEGQARKTLTLSTVHKSKGREWPRVFLLNKKELMPSKFARQRWQMDQENNLIYVAITRAQEELIYLD